MSDAVKIAILGLIGTVVTAILSTAGVVLIYLVNRKVNGINHHLQGKLDKQSDQIINLANGKKSDAE